MTAQAQGRSRGYSTAAIAAVLLVFLIYLQAHGGTVTRHRLTALARSEAAKRLAPLAIPADLPGRDAAVDWLRAYQRQQEQLPAGHRGGCCAALATSCASYNATVPKSSAGASLDLSQDGPGPKRYLVLSAVGDGWDPVHINQ